MAVCSICSVCLLDPSRLKVLPGLPVRSTPSDWFECRLPVGGLPRAAGHANPPARMPALSDFADQALFEDAAGIVKGDAEGEGRGPAAAGKKAQVSDFNDMQSAGRTRRSAG